MACTWRIKDSSCHPCLMLSPRGALLVLYTDSGFTLGTEGPLRNLEAQHINNTSVSSALKPSAEDTGLALMEGRQIKRTGWSLMYYLAV